MSHRIGGRWAGIVGAVASVCTIASFFGVKAEAIPAELAVTFTVAVISMAAFLAYFASLDAEEAPAMERTQQLSSNRGSALPSAQETAHDDSQAVIAEHRARLAQVQYPNGPPNHFEHCSRLIGQDYLNLAGERETADAFLYPEATELLKRARLVGSIHPDVSRAIGEAIERWVAAGYWKLHEYAPSLVRDKQGTIRRLHRAAYIHLHRGWVVQFEPEHTMRPICTHIGEQVQRWVQQQFIERC